MTNETLSGDAEAVAGSPRAVATGRLGAALSGLVAQWLRGLTINAHERLAIVHLWEHGPMTMSELGARIPLSRAAVTALTDRLEALSYVRRTPDAQDRRRTVLTLTDRPATLITDMVLEWTQSIAAIERGFSSAELDTVERYMGELSRLSQEHAAQLRARTEAELPQA